MRYLVLISILSLFKTISSAQPNDSTLLSPPYHEFNSFVSQDYLGFLWISSGNGLYRHDGTKATFYPVKDVSQPKTYNQIIQSNMFTDESGKMWFTTYDGLHNFDIESDCFNSRQIKLNGQWIDNNYQIIAIEKQFDKLWLCLDDKFGQFDIKTGSFSVLPFDIK